MPKSTTKKTPARKAPKKPTIKQRARAIVENEDYDLNTRTAIDYNLRCNKPELAELVERAEKGDIILDSARDVERANEAAKLVIKLCNESAAPDFLSTAVIRTLHRASLEKDFNIWDEPDLGEFDEKALTEFFIMTHGFHPDLEKLLGPVEDFESKSAVAQHVHALLHNPNTPTVLWEAIAEFVCEQTNRAEKFAHTRPVLELLFETVDSSDVIGEKARGHERE